MKVLLEYTHNGKSGEPCFRETMVIAMMLYMDMCLSC